MRDNYRVDLLIDNQFGYQGTLLKDLRPFFSFYLGESVNNIPLTGDAEAINDAFVQLQQQRPFQSLKSSIDLSRGIDQVLIELVLQPQNL